MKNINEQINSQSLELKQRQNEELKRKQAKRESNRLAIIGITVILIIAWYLMQ